MGQARMLRPWRGAVQAALPGLHGHQVKALSDASWAMIQARHCQLSRMAAATPGDATTPSRERRYQRLVANDRIDPDAVVDTWAHTVLGGGGSRTLLLDETARGPGLRVMKLSRQQGGRACPVLWRTYRTGRAPMHQVELVLDLLRRADAAMDDDDGPRPTLMADRGLSWPAVLDFCVERGWHYLLRIQSSTRVRVDGEDGECSAGELVPRRGMRWCGSAQVFKNAGWRRVNLVARRPADDDDPWLLITDLPATGHRCRQYRKRMRQEQSFRDEKSHGFRWTESRIDDPTHVQRLLLIMALATAWLLWMGQRLIRDGRRRLLERRDRRTLSIFQLGLRYFQHHLNPTRPPPCWKSVGR